MAGYLLPQCYLLQLGFYTLKILVQHNKLHNTKIQYGVKISPTTKTKTKKVVTTLSSIINSTTGTYLSITSV